MLVAMLNDLLEAELHQQLWQQCQAANWRFGHNSTGSQGIQEFWKMDLDENDTCNQAWQAARPKCENLINQPLTVIRQYANGHTYGLGGQTHQDDTREGCYTLLYYANPEWQQIWHGETVYYDEQEEIMAAIKPAPNRGVFFDSRIPHAGRGPSRYFGGLRVTVAFKLEVVG